MGFPFAAIGPAISGIGSVLGAFGVGNRGGPDIGAQQQFSMQQLQMQEAFQREMAQNSISWRVQDAARAGISPLAALGAPTFSPTVSAPGIDYSGGGGGNSLAAGLSSAGANIGDAVSKTMTGQDKSQALYQMTIRDQQIKSNDLDIAIKGAQLAKINQTLQTPSAPPVTPQTGPLAGQGMVKIVPDKVTSGAADDPSRVAGVHPSTAMQQGVHNTYSEPVSPAVINNPSITNPFLWSWAGHRFIPQYEDWFDSHITNPIRSWLGMPAYQRH